MTHNYLIEVSETITMYNLLIPQSQVSFIKEGGQGKAACKNADSDVLWNLEFVSTHRVIIQVHWQSKSEVIWDIISYLEGHPSVTWAYCLLETACESRHFNLCQVGCNLYGYFRSP